MKVALDLLFYGSVFALLCWAVEYDRRYGTPREL